ncbi:hypothetical protein GQ42DRAFT_12598 [Ramicandelaber brevisporus]|nr:hypothetical protein GQ42DRAFT_12598 [Ramicandelaber brevisporus]
MKATISVATLLVAASSAVSAAVYFDPQAMCNLVNGYRARNGVPPLSYNPCGNAVSNTQTQRMAHANVQSHLSGDGAATYQASCRSSPGWTGQIVGYSPAWKSMESMADAFYREPLHQRIMLDPKYKCCSAAHTTGQNNNEGYSIDFATNCQPGKPAPQPPVVKPPTTSYTAPKPTTAPTYVPPAKPAPSYVSPAPAPAPAPQQPTYVAQPPPAAYVPPAAVPANTCCAQQCCNAPAQKAFY